MARKLRIFILEDDKIRNRHFWDHLHSHNTTFAVTYDTAIKLFKDDPPYDIMFLDHDLGGFKTGYDFACLMAAFGIKVPTVIHSFNDAGAKRMRGKLPHAVLAPFGGKYFNQIIRRIEHESNSK